MVFTRILTTISRDRISILASRHVQSTTNPQTAALASMISQERVSRDCIVNMRKRFALMPTASVRQYFLSNNEFKSI